MIDTMIAKVLIKRSILYRLAVKGKKEATWMLKRPFSRQILEMTEEEAVQTVSSVCPCPAVIQPPARMDYGNPNKDLSIIIPVYNVEKYVKKCIDSVLNQDTSYEIEVIVVNDGSTDSSAEILKEYEAVPEVVVIHKANGGLSSARNAGMMRASGRYLLFLDSDDYMTEGSIDCVMNQAEAEKCDIVQMQYKQLAGDILLPSEESFPSRTFRSYAQMCQIPGYAWMKLYRSTLFEGVIFPEGYWFEDTIIHLILFSRCRKMSVIDKVGYIYRYNGQGITYSIRKSSRCLESLWVVMHVMDMRKELGMKMDSDVYREGLIHLSRILYMRIRDVEENVQKAAFVMCCGLVKQWKEEVGGETPKLSGRLKILEKAFIQKDYGTWLLYCRSI